MEDVDCSAFVITGSRQEEKEVGNSCVNDVDSNVCNNNLDTCSENNVCDSNLDAKMKNSVLKLLKSKISLIKP